MKNNTMVEETAAIGNAEAAEVTSIDEAELAKVQGGAVPNFVAFKAPKLVAVTPLLKQVRLIAVHL